MPSRSGNRKRLGPAGVAATAVILVGVALLSSSGATAGPARSHARAAADDQLVVDTQFGALTGDPAASNAIAQYYTLGLVYDTLVTIKPNAGGKYDLRYPQPALAQSWSMNQDGTVFKFRLRKNLVFSDGSPLTSKDVVFSLNRVTNLKGPGAFVGSCFKDVTAPDAQTVVIATTGPCPGLPAALTSKSAGIVNSDVVRQHGGTDAANAATADKAGTYFNDHSLGSGPYVVESYTPNSSLVLMRNPRYWGKAPFFKKLVFQNVDPNIARLDVLSGRAQVALGLSADQASSLSGNSRVQVVSKPSSTVFYLQANADKKVSPLAANAKFWNALRYAIDYGDLVRLIGKGAQQACGIVPSISLGALPSTACFRHDVKKAKQWLAKAGAGSTQVELEFPTDFALNGVPFQTVAEAVQGYLKKAGINVVLKGSPFATWLPRWKNGSQQLNIGALGPAYVDPSQMLVYAPTGYRGQYAGYKPTDSPLIRNAAHTAEIAMSASARRKAYQSFQRVLNKYSPFIPLFDAPQTVVAAKTLQHVGVSMNPQYVFDATLLTSR